MKAMATDPEFAQALIERNERRRKTVKDLIGRMAGKSCATPGAARRRRHHFCNDKLRHVRDAARRQVHRRSLRARTIGLPCSPRAAVARSNERSTRK